jgi:hypothetical protein
MRGPVFPGYWPWLVRACRSARRVDGCRRGGLARAGVAETSSLRFLRNRPLGDFIQRLQHLNACVARTVPSILNCSKRCAIVTSADFNRADVSVLGPAQVARANLFGG